MENTKLTDVEIQKLAAAKDNEAVWNAVCDEIKAARGGQYPPDWYVVVIIGILAGKPRTTVVAL